MVNNYVNVTIVSCNKITIIGHDSLFYRIYWKFVVNIIDPFSGVNMFHTKIKF